MATLVRQRDRLDLERAAIDQERAARAACDGGELIHDPAGDARRKLLGALAGEGELRRRQLEVRDVAQRERERHLQRRRRREPGADGNRRRDLSVHPDVRPAVLAEHGAQGVDVAVRAGVPVEPVDFDDVVCPRRRVHDALEVDRHRQDQSVVVVGVVADQVDAARRAEARHGRPGRRDPLARLRGRRSLGRASAPEWASDAHLEVVVSLLERHGITVATYATWIDPSNVAPSGELAQGLEQLVEARPVRLQRREVVVRRPVAVTPAVQVPAGLTRHVVGGHERDHGVGVGRSSRGSGLEEAFGIGVAAPRPNGIPPHPGAPQEMIRQRTTD